jgi:hypothetical protein
MNKKITLFVLCVMLLSSCADAQHVEACLQGHQYGILGGFWHGLIAPLSFIGSLFSDDIAVWAPNNNGVWYSLGFLCGVYSETRIFGMAI